MSFIRKLRQKTRSARLQAFRQFVDALRRSLPPGRQVLRVADLGGTVKFWESDWKISDQDCLRVTLVNHHAIDRTQARQQVRARYITAFEADATKLTVEYLRGFDLIFSNSFLEHLESGELQSSLAQKIAASGVPYFIQVPNKLCAIDPHFPLAPWFACWPAWLRWRSLLLSGFGAARACSIEEARLRMRFYHPLGAADMRRLFPGASIRVERPLGIPMSILTSNLGPEPFAAASTTPPLAAHG